MAASTFAQFTPAFVVIQTFASSVPTRRTDAFDGAIASVVIVPNVVLIPPSPSVRSGEIETQFVDRWRTRLQSAYPEISSGTGSDDGYGLSRFLRDEFPMAFGSVSVVAARSSFLDGTPVAALVLSGIGVVLLLGGGWLGGRLVFGFGARVADESDQLPAHHISAPAGGRSPARPGPDPAQG